MFARLKKSGNREYVQLVENHWIKGQPRQTVIATLGRLDRLRAQGQVDAVIHSLSRFSERVGALEGYRSGQLAARSVKSLGPSLMLDRLWHRLGIDEVLTGLLTDRHFKFAVERAIYFVVFSRLFFPGSDLKASQLARDYVVTVPSELKLHHLYRAMAWLGAAKDEVEERLFARNRDLFSRLKLVFFDTTSIYFEGEGGESLGQHGHSKDGCPEEKQMIVGAVIDSNGRPISCPMWPGNQADVTTLRPVIERLRTRFGVREMVAVADRGMISRKTIDWLEASHLGYILGVRMRQEKKVLANALDTADDYCAVKDNLKVKERLINGQRYIICLNPDEAQRDALARATMVESLREKLKQSAKGIVGNRGYRRYLKIEKNAVRIEEAKIEAEARYDGKYVLRTNTRLKAEEVALQYKELWQVERVFREVKSLLETRPVFHKYDLTIKGHVFCSFLALVVMKELLKEVEQVAGWDEIKRDLNALYEVVVEQGSKRFRLRSPLLGVSGQVLKGVGIAPPPMVAEVPS
jgi:transposase